MLTFWHLVLFFFANLASAHWVARSVDVVADESMDPVAPVLGVADGVVAAEPAADGALVVCADAMVAPPMSRTAAAAVRPVFLKVISFSSWGRAWRAVDVGLSRSWLNVPKARRLPSKAGFPKGKSNRFVRSSGPESDIRKARFARPLRMWFHRSKEHPRTPNSRNTPDNEGARTCWNG